MSYCLNPQCQKAQNPEGNKFCQNCGAKLLLGDRYRALKPVGKSSNSRTFLAADEQDAAKRRCVIKQFRTSARDTAESLQEEVMRLEELGKHPQIPEMLAHFERDGRQYLVQEFIEGENLAQQLAKEGAFDDTQIRQLLDEVLPVLEFLHASELIHRDIKPENIIRRRSDRILVLVGFGAAKHATEAAMAKTGTLIGSAEYAPPEQLMGKAVFASDLYSLGVSCIHLLTDIHPFDLYDCMDGKWIWRDYAGERLTPGLGRVLDKMLETSVRRRYQSAAEVYADLNPSKVLNVPPIVRRSPRVSQPISLSQEITAPPPPPKPQAPPPPPKPKPPSWQCDRTLNGSESAAEITAVALSPQSRILASASWDATVKLWDLGSGEEKPQQMPLHAIAAHASGVVAIAVSPDGQTLASASADCTVKLWRLWQLAPAEIRAGTKPILAAHLIGHSSMVTAVVISPDGQTLATGSRDKTIKLWNLKTGELRQTLTDHSDRILSLAISSDSQILASGSADNAIKIWKLNGGELVQTLTDHVGAVNAVAISPDGKTLFSGSWDRSVKLWSLETGSPLQVLSGHLLSVSAIAISRDGKTLATASHDATIKLWNLPQAELLATLSGHARGVNAVAFSPDGKTLISGSQDGSIKIWRFD